MWTKVKVDENLGSRLKIKFSPVLWKFIPQLQVMCLHQTGNKKGKKKKKKMTFHTFTFSIFYLAAVHQIQ